MEEQEKLDLETQHVDKTDRAYVRLVVFVLVMSSLFVANLVMESFW